LYRHFRSDEHIPFEYFASRGTPLSDALSFARFDTAQSESWSAFGDTSYRLGERVTLGAGVRYFQETQDLTDFTDSTAIKQQTGRFHSADPRVYAQLKVASNANVYASAAKGFRSGGFNDFLNGQQQPPFGPEDVWTYELGAKGILLDGRFSFDAATYLSNYSNYQMFANVNPVRALFFNAGAVRIKGVEGNLTWNPFGHWRLEARGNYVNARFTEINVYSGNLEAVGDPLDDVPRYQFTLSGQHVGKQDVVRLDYNQTSSTAFRNRFAGPWYYATSPVIQMLNLHMSSMLKDNLRVGFSVQNLLNDQSFVSPNWYASEGARSRPRTFGVDFSATFE
jgi:outer membrane receptor protein involved in Fe transport